MLPIGEEPPSRRGDLEQSDGKAEIFLASFSTRARITNHLRTVEIRRMRPRCRIPLGFVERSERSTVNDYSDE